MAKGRGKSNRKDTPKKFSRKGLVLTVAILGIITAASFVVWLVPQNSQVTFVTSDHMAQLDAVANIHETLRVSFQEQYDMALNGQITADEYVDAAQVLSDQTVQQISLLATANPPPEWSDSYAMYMESLRAFNSMLRESIILMDDTQNTDTLDNITKLNDTVTEYIVSSESARP